VLWRAARRGIAESCGLALDQDVGWVFGQFMLLMLGTDIGEEVVFQQQI
jgi:hypothetical protein